MYDELVKRVAEHLKEKGADMSAMTANTRTGMTEEEEFEWLGGLFGHCEDCVFVSRGKELNYVGWCYKHERNVKPKWGCNEFTSLAKELAKKLLKGVFDHE
ncbi:MAG: hypothetical protein IKG47_00425 [Oscillospiraceae bacterium]|nr:hypothetical protein [Clostridiales bacterium]MBR3353810.1 hypothetical protein [Oscillospiraceae bacterium]